MAPIPAKLPEVDLRQAVLVALTVCGLPIFSIPIRASAQHGKHANSAKSACTAITQAVLKKCTGGGEKKPNDDLTVLVVSFAWH